MTDVRDAAKIDDVASDPFGAAAAARGFGGARWDALGTTARVVVTDPAALPGVRAAVEAAVDAIDLAASRFRDDSELQQLNNAAGEWRDASPLLVRALRVALDAAEWTGGLVDPTVGASMVGLGYDRTFRLVAADGPAITVALHAAPGWQAVELDDAAARVRIPRGTLIDLGATAKGLASDIAAADAAAAAGCGVLVSLGGDIAVAGDAPEGGWSVLVEDVHEAADPDAPSQTIGLLRGGLATSSTRARRWRRGGSELHHIIDPRSGGPARGPWRTVSTLAETCVLANAGSTAAMVMGAGAERWLADRNIPARLVTHEGHITRVSGWPEEVGA
ncbi:MAG TPA: FAD:protein FMN transferase [Mycobacteriales bacterium]|nr:FAD:protein FMN transferase [Mycobacteriales bacterium]